MKVQAIFSKKPRYIPADMKENTCKLLTKMNLEAVHKTSADFFETSEVRGLKIGDAYFKDGKFLAERDSEDRLTAYGKGKSMLEFNKVRLVIDNRNGQIIKHKKPFFKSWKSILKQAQSIISTGLEQYNNTDIVQKIMYKKRGLTPLGKLKTALDYADIMKTFNKFAGK